MPRVDDPREFAEEEERRYQAPYDDFKSEPRYLLKRIFDGGMALFYLALSLVYLFVPLYFNENGEGYCYLLTGLSDIATGEIAVGFVAVAVYLLIAVHFGILVFKPLEISEKRGFFGFIAATLVSLVITFAFGMLENNALMAIALGTALISLFLIYLDFKFFHDL